MRKIKRLSDAYRFKGFIPEGEVRGVFGDPQAVEIRLKRVKKNDLPVVRLFVEDVLRSE